MEKKKFAVLGYGTVGKGVAEVWSELENAPLALGPILVRRDFPGDRFGELLVKDFSVIEAAPDVVLVAEVIGGKDAAYEYSKRALLAGFLCRFRLGQNDSMSLLCISTNRHRFPPECRVEHHLHAGIKAVHVTVKDYPIFHSYLHLPFRIHGL